MLILKGRSDDSVFTAAGEMPGTGQIPLERGRCNVSHDAKLGPNNELLKKLERCVLCE